MAQVESDLPLNADDACFSSLTVVARDVDDETIIDQPMSDAKYAEELQVQEVIMASSAFISGTSIDTASCSSSTLRIQSSQTVPSIPTRQVVDDPEAENDKSFQILCGICVEVKNTDRMFTNESCAHSFCSDCITKQVAAKLDEKIHNVSCPGLNCKLFLELDACSSILPKLVLERWNEALCEAFFLGEQKVYCPFSDCSTALVIENDAEALRESECPVCHRLFCARCQVPWHPGIDCEEFQKLNEDERGREDLMVKEMAKENKWKRCPRCKFYVERTQGCLHITCRCHYQFCYSCGAEWTSSHGGCQSQCVRD